jgi:hypothetical protein
MKKSMQPPDGFVDMEAACSKLAREEQTIKNGTKRWGKWQFNAKKGYLYRKLTPTHSYRVRLAECNTPEELSDWLFHLSEKDWLDAEQLGWFVKAIVDISENVGLGKFRIGS